MLIFNNELIALLRAKAIISNKLNINEEIINTQSVLSDLGANFLDILEISTALEDEFLGARIEVDQSLFYTLKVGDLVTQVLSTALPVDDLRKPSKKVFDALIFKTKKLFSIFYGERFDKSLEYHEIQENKNLGLDDISLKEFKAALEKFYSINLIGKVTKESTFMDLVHLIIKAVSMKAQNTDFATM